MRNKRASKNSSGHFKDLLETCRVDSTGLPTIVRARFVLGFSNFFFLVCMFFTVCGCADGELDCIGGLQLFFDS